MSESASHDGHEQHGSMALYLSVFVGLCILTAISFGVANSPLMATPAVGWVVMMAVSCMKAMLVIMFFMHLKWEANWKYVLTFPALAMSLFLVCMLIPDVGLRNRNNTRERELFMAHPQAEHADEHATGGDDGTHTEKPEH